MSFFDDNDDPFDSIVREFFGGPVRRRKRGEHFISGEDEDRTIDFIEDDNYIYLVFELSGFNEEDISVNIKGKDLEITAQKLNEENIQDYLHQKLRQGLFVKKHLPNFINPKSFTHTMRNGVLEIIFNKSGEENKNERRKI